MLPVGFFFFFFFVLLAAVVFDDLGAAPEFFSLSWRTSFSTARVLEGHSAPP